MGRCDVDVLSGGLGWFWHGKDDIADRLDAGRALQAISLASTREMTSFTAVWMSLVPWVSRQMLGSMVPFKRTSLDMRDV